MIGTHLPAGRSVFSTSSPRPRTMALGPLRKKGTSLPMDLAISISRCRGQCKFHRRFKATRIEAPSELPPPRPAPTGMRFCSATPRPKSVVAPLSLFLGSASESRASPTISFSVRWFEETREAMSPAELPFATESASAATALTTRLLASQGTVGASHCSVKRPCERSITNMSKSPTVLIQLTIG